MLYDSKKEPSKVTIGMCVRNSQATVRQAIESILAQDYPREFMELVVVDGCSKDKTLQIIQDILEEPDFDVRVYSENEGLGYARQIVVDAAHGDFIIWVDGDMVLAKDFVRRQVEFMVKHTNVGIAKGKYGILRGPERESVVASLENFEFLIHTSTEGKTDSRALGASGCIYRVKALRRIGGFDTNIKGVGEDQDVENRIREDGWELHVSSAVFYETRRQTWGSLWKEYFWHGSGGRYVFEKDKHVIRRYKLIPPIAMLAEISRIPKAYRLTHRKIVLLLPLHYLFKRTAWVLGFISGFREK